MEDNGNAKLQADLEMYRQIWTEQVETLVYVTKSIEDLTDTIRDLQVQLQAQPTSFDKFYRWTETWPGRVFVISFAIIALTSFGINISEVADAFKIFIGGN